MSNYSGSTEDILFISDNTDPALNSFLGKLLSRYAPDVKYGSTSCGYGCSDHASWTKIGVPSAFPFEAKMNEDNPNIHSDKDTLAQIGGNSDHAANFAKLAVAYLVEMAK
jgi:leucyl aminopeptidase